jgi:uncharacterized repeat protein (TIGR03806 family)
MNTFTKRQALAMGLCAISAALLGGCGAEPAEPLQTHSEVNGAPGFLNFPEHAADAASSPEWLSQTGAFDDLVSLSAAQALMPYGVQSPLWSDGADKRRWLALPEDGTIGFSAQADWAFPEGTVFVKHFAMALDESRPEELHRLETRFWIAARDGEFYGAVYKWEADQSDARLLSEGASEELSIVGRDGTLRSQTYSYPSSATCGTCHSAAAGPVRGVRTGQLNGDYDYGLARGETEVLANQLQTFSGLGLFSEPISDPAEYPELAAVSDESATLEHRVRSYWDSNCSMCHDDSPSSPSWDARFETPLAEQGVLMATPRAGTGPEDVRLIYPGEPERSLLYRRTNSTEPGVRMPPILKNHIDQAYVDLLARWILSLPASELPASEPTGG